jgi:hypothetical protein
MASRRMIVGLFRDPADAEAAIRELRASGFRDRDIGVALREGADRFSDIDAGVAGKAASRAVGGGLVGGLIGLLGSLLIPGVGPIVVGGMLASALAGVGVGAATGGLIGGLADIGVPEADARHFDEGLRDGLTLVSLDAGNRAAEALAILDRHGMDHGPSGAGGYARERRVAGDLSFHGPERRLTAV